MESHTEASEDNVFGDDQMILDELQFWADLSARSASEQMAMDEAAFQWSAATGAALLRFYQWTEPTVTIGYFDDYPENEIRPVIRRMTGGGLVEHGQDITFCLTLPPGCTSARARTEDRYRWIHESLRDALLAENVELKFAANISSDRGPCFSNPVKWDLLDSDGNKLIGGAQRKSKGAVIHQGSIHLKIPTSAEPSRARRFAEKLGYRIDSIPSAVIVEIENAAETLNLNKYSTTLWNRNRKISSR